MRTLHWLIPGIAAAGLLALLTLNTSTEDNLEPTIKGSRSATAQPTLPSHDGDTTTSQVPATAPAALAYASKLPNLPRLKSLRLPARGADAGNLQESTYQLINSGKVDAKGTKRLLGLLREHKNPELLATVLWGLGTSKQRGVAREITRFAMRTPFPALQRSAIDALSALGNERAGDGLARLAGSHDNPATRARAILKLGLSRAGDPSAVAALEKAALTDGNAMVRAKAIEGLRASRATEGLQTIAKQGVTPGERARAQELLQHERRLAGAGPRETAVLLREAVRKSDTPNITTR